MEAQITTDPGPGLTPGNIFDDMRTPQAPQHKDEYTTTPDEDGRGKEFERGNIPSFETIQLEQLAFWMNRQKDFGNYVYLADMTGRAH